LYVTIIVPAIVGQAWNFVRHIEKRPRSLSPQLITFNGNSLDLPVLRYRAMVHGVSAPGLSVRPYFHRYTEDAIVVFGHKA
jgi:predicted PolB exonuclease-like 3'-5' exonuclease